jgi:predicted nucleotidyltransferase
MNKEQIKSILAELVRGEPLQKEIQRLALFGSYVTGSATDISDVDVLVDFEPEAHIGLFRFVRIQRAFAEALGRKVDLVTPQALSKFIREDVLRRAEVFYEK